MMSLRVPGWHCGSADHATSRLRRVRPPPPIPACQPWRTPGLTQTEVLGALLLPPEGRTYVVLLGKKNQGSAMMGLSDASRRVVYLLATGYAGTWSGKLKQG